MRASMAYAKTIHKTLKANGWVTNDSESNLDGFKLDGQTAEGFITVCVLDIALQLPDGADCEDVNVIMDFLEERHADTKKRHLHKELVERMGRGENLTDGEMAQHSKLSEEFGTMLRSDPPF